MRDQVSAQIICLLVTVVVTIVVSAFGYVINLRWKESDDFGLCGMAHRGILGLAGWIFFFTLMTSINYIIISSPDLFNCGSVCIISGLLTVVFMLPVFIKAKKIIKNPVIVTLLALLASMGSFTGVLLTVSLIGLPIKKLLDMKDYDPFALKVVEKGKYNVSAVDEEGNLKESGINLSYDEEKKFDEY